MFTADVLRVRSDGAIEILSLSFAQAGRLLRGGRSRPERRHRVLFAVEGWNGAEEV